MAQQYRLKFEEGILRDIDRLPGHMRQRIKRTIQNLTVDPRPKGANPLRDRPAHYRIRIDDWRILYRIEDEYLIIIVLKVGLKKGPEFYEE